MNADEYRGAAAARLAMRRLWRWSPAKTLSAFICVHLWLSFLRRHALPWRCLRLLALIDLVARAPWALPLCRLERDGAELHPSLLRIAATTPLTAEARFDPDRFRTNLPPFLLGPAPVPRISGARL